MGAGDLGRVHHLGAAAPVPAGGLELPALVCRSPLGLGPPVAEVLIGQPAADGVVGRVAAQQQLGELALQFSRVAGQPFLEASALLRIQEWLLDPCDQCRPSQPVAPSRFML
ncbi:hypothetical protein H8F24_16040 [Synechococcus sp. CBW1002]|uniref:hypothetical protein n=1 Tax=Synechococcus sp. CBW1002 TaxID=1353134 RepID=UPI0018CF0A80|nr:hypothetical protein [Synechococcus sp. CBW1002]QPN59498.1 hypothetical protein H8F24_16040 [Synechococcus sp. CBW1002]